jgi:hypothetical protein
MRDIDSGKEKVYPMENVMDRTETMDGKPRR